MPIVWTVTPEKALNDLTDDYIRRIEAGVVAIANHFSPQIEAWMQSNRPWTDRTNMARQTLHTEVNQLVGQMVEIVLAHGVDYGWYLEGWNPAANQAMQNAGRWAIIEPALDYWAPQIWQAVVRMLR